MITMPPEAVNDDRHSYTIATKSFAELLDHVRTWRAALSVLTQQANVGHFAAPGSIGPNSDKRRFYALGTCVGSKEHTILYVDIPLSFSESGSDGGARFDVDPSIKMAAAAASGFGEAEKDELMGEDPESSLPTVEWKPLLRIQVCCVRFRLGCGPPPESLGAMVVHRNLTISIIPGRSIESWDDDERRGTASRAPPMHDSRHHVVRLRTHLGYIPVFGEWAFVSMQRRSNGKVCFRELT